MASSCPISAARQSDDLQAFPNAAITINNLQIALLDGTITVKSDGAMTYLRA